MFDSSSPGRTPATTASAECISGHSMDAPESAYSVYNSGPNVLNTASVGLRTDFKCMCVQLSRRCGVEFLPVISEAVRRGRRREFALRFPKTGHCRLSSISSFALIGLCDRIARKMSRCISADFLRYREGFAGHGWLLNKLMVSSSRISSKIELPVA